MSEESTALAGAGFMAVLALLGGIPSCAAFHSIGQTDIRAQAIERGLGEYRVDQKTQKVEFFWTVKAVGGSVEVERQNPARKMTGVP